MRSIRLTWKGYMFSETGLTKMFSVQTTAVFQMQL